MMTYDKDYFSLVVPTVSLKSPHICPLYEVARTQIYFTQIQRLVWSSIVSNKEMTGPAEYKTGQN